MLQYTFLIVLLIGEGVVKELINQYS